MRSETVFVALYQEDGKAVDFLGVFKSLEAGRNASDAHYMTYHPGSPKWSATYWGAEAIHDRARYIVREMEVIDH